MEPNPTYTISHNKGNQKRNEKTTYKVGENIFKQCDPQGINIQNIQIGTQLNIYLKNQYSIV